MRLVLAWVEIHRDDLMADWQLAVSGQPPFKIEPLRWTVNPRGTSVVPTDGYKLHITFSNGEIGVYDCTPLLTFGVFQELRDAGYFNQARAQGGTVVWPHEQDICPDTLYEDSTKRSAE